ncbi:unnamed protein product, partial [Urochloa humidicola]
TEKREFRLEEKRYKERELRFNPELLLISMERVASSCASLLSQRRGYSVATAVVKGPARKVVEKVAKRVMGKEVKTAAASPEKTPWVPDPVTGYYRPAGVPKELDAAELRAKLLPQSVAN